ncbi:hypothetical protein M8J77_024635 [Diaphorina citri]|nr:hypothetical protein M8J77_024635 [Diaphorina citri]
MWRFLSSIAVEQTLLVNMIALAISEHAAFNLIFQKACDSTHSRPLYLGQRCPTEENAEKESAQLSVYRAMINAACVCVILMYVGSWSDSHGKQRKPFIIYSIIGQITVDILNSVLSYYWSTSNYWVAILNGLIPGITGSRLLLMTMSVCYISDNTSLRTRTFRIGILAALYYLATPFGTALSGKLMVRFGFLVTFSTCILLNTLALAIATLLIVNTRDDYDPRCIDSFPRQIANNFKVLVRRRPHNSRLIVCLCVVTSPLVRSPMVGEYSVLYLFVRYKFGWNEADYGYYAAFKLAGIFFGTLFSMGILSKTCGMSDSMIGILASVSDMAAATCYIFVTSSWQMFLVPLLDIFHGAAQVICSSVVSKHVEPNELGKITSVKAFLDSLAPFLITPLYNQVYIHTFQQLPSAFFIISVVFGLPIFFIFWIIRSKDHIEGKGECKPPKRDIYNNFNNNNEDKIQQQPSNNSINAQQLDCTQKQLSDQIETIS